MKRSFISIVGLFMTLTMVSAPTSTEAAKRVAAECACVSKAYPPSSATVSASSGSPVPGGAITLTASGFCAGDVVTFTIGGTVIGTAIADSTGSASIATTAPTAVGSYTVVASTTDEACPLSASLALTVTAAATTSGGLPATGTDPSAGLLMGGLAVVLGAGLLGVAAIRRRPRTAHLPT